MKKQLNLSVVVRQNTSTAAVCSCGIPRCISTFNVTHILPLLPLVCKGNVSSDSKSQWECELCVRFRKIESNTSLATLRSVYVTGIVLLDNGELLEDVSNILIKCLSRDKDTVRLKMEKVLTGILHDFLKKKIFKKTREMFSCAGDANDTEMSMEEAPAATKLSPCHYATNTMTKHKSLQMESFQKRSPFQMIQGMCVIIHIFMEKKKSVCKKL